jgi:GTP-binding protein HflX
LDISHPNAQEQADTVQRVLQELEVGEIPQIVALNKIDRVGATTPADLGTLALDLGIPADHVAISARHGWGLEALLQRIETLLDRENVSIEVTIPYSRQDLVNLLRERGRIMAEEYVEEGIRLKGRLPQRYLRRFEGLG